MAYISLKDRFTIPDYINPDELVTGLLDFSDDKCVRCRLCTTMCPARSIKLKKAQKKGTKEKPLPELVMLADGISACIACGCCAAACPEGAISIRQGFLPMLFYQRFHQQKEMSFPVRY